MENISNEIMHLYAYIWLSRVLGPGNVKSFEIMERFSGAENICTKSYLELKALDVFSTAELQRAKAADKDSILKTIEYCRQNNIRIITPLTDEYPPGFGFIEAPPPVIYARGEKLDRDCPYISVVGSRKCSEFGLKAAYSLSARLSLSGFTVVSGGAMGIDSMAHRGTIAAGGKTVAILGSGIDSDYLKANKGLREQIVLHGTVISELEPKAPAGRHTFPIRNRLISALSAGIVVIEAGEKSGALITAGYAMEQGKEVFALPGSITDENYVGNNALIRDGAIPVTAAEDVVSLYLGRFSDKIKLKTALTEEIKKGFSVALKEQSSAKSGSAAKRTAKKPKPHLESTKTVENGSAEKSIADFSGSENAKRILQAFREDTEMSDTLSALSGVTGGNFIVAITELEIKGYITAVPVGRYKRNY